MIEVTAQEGRRFWGMQTFTGGGENTQCLSENIFEFLESVVIQEWWPDSRRVTDVDGEEPRTLRPQQIAIPE